MNIYGKVELVTKLQSKYLSENNLGMYYFVTNYRDYLTLDYLSKLLNVRNKKLLLT